MIESVQLGGMLNQIFTSAMPRYTGREEAIGHARHENTIGDYTVMAGLTYDVVDGVERWGVVVEVFSAHDRTSETEVVEFVRFRGELRPGRGLVVQSEQRGHQVVFWFPPRHKPNLMGTTFMVRELLTA